MDSRSRAEPPYPTVIVNQRDPEGPPSIPKRVATACGCFIAVASVVGLLLKIGVWVHQVDQTVAAGPARPEHGAEPGEVPGASDDFVAKPDAAPLNAIRAPASGDVVGRRFRVRGRLHESLGPQEVLAAFTKHGNLYWGKGIIEVTRSGTFDHTVDEGGEQGTFTLVVAALPAEIAAEVERTIESEHSRRLYTPWKRQHLGGERFRPLGDVRLELRREGKLD